MGAFATTDGIKGSYTSIQKAFDFISQVEETDIDIDCDPSDSVKYKNGELSVDGEQMPVTEFAYSQILTKIGIPASFATRCPEKLLSINIRKMLKEKDNSNWKVRTRLDADGQRYIRAVVTDRYNPLKDSGILLRSMDGLSGSNASDFNVRFCDNMMRITALTSKEVTPDTDKGDITKVGIDITNGTTGLIRYSAGMYLYRLVCKNGLVVPSLMAGMSRKHIGKDFYEDYSSTLQDIFCSYDNVSKVWGSLSSTAIKNSRYSAINRSRLLVEAVIGRKETRDIFENQVDQNGSLYSLVNVLTRRAHTVESIISRRDLESAAGALLLAA